jgi:hypothetical protein
VASEPSSGVDRSISGLMRAHPADHTLQNLLSVMNAKLDTSTRLIVYEYEATREGFHECASTFEALVEVERQSFEALVACLRAHLDATSHAPATERRQT